MSGRLVLGGSPAARRTTAGAGLVSVLLQLGGQSLMTVGGDGPAFAAQAPEILQFFTDVDPGLFAVGSYLTGLSMLSLLWFFGGRYAVLRDDWRAPIALGCGVVYAAGAGVGWQLAAFRVDDGLDPQLARLGFDLGNLSFAAAWVALGGFAIATGWLLLSSRDRSGLIGWLGIVAGVALIAARAVWTTEFWLVGYFLFWVFAGWLCVLLLRRQVKGRPTLGNPS